VTFFRNMLIGAVFVFFMSVSVSADPVMMTSSESPWIPDYTPDWEWCPIGFDMMDAEQYPPSPDERCEFFVDGFSLYAVHHDAVYNCCIDDIQIDVSVVKKTIRIVENEVWTMPCYCYCYFKTSVEIHHLKPGEYTVEVWSRWMGGEMDLRCVDEIEISPDASSADIAR